MVVPQYPYPVMGGLENQAHELSRALMRQGVSVQVVSGQTAPGQSAEELVDGVVVHRVPWSGRKALRFAALPVRLARVLRRHRTGYDVVHLHQMSWFSLFVLVIVKALGKPVLVKVPGIGVYGPPGLAASRFGWLKMRILRLADAAIAMTTQSITEIEAAGFPPGRILRTPNGIRLLPPPVNDGSPGTGACRFVFVGRLSHEKSLDTLLEAWRRLLALPGVPPVHLELWGTGPLRDPLEQWCRDSGIAGCVTFRGHVDDVRARLHTMDVFVLPSLTEGNSNAVLEAMAAGLPVVSTPVGGTPMQVGDEGADLLFAPRDVDGLLARLKALAGDAELRRRQGAAMRSRIERYFEIDRVAGTYLAAYRLLATDRADALESVANPVVVLPGAA